MGHRMGRRLAWLVAAAAMFLGGCANPVTDALIEQPLGKLSEFGVGLQFRMDDDPLLRGYIGRVGAEQRELARRKNVPYRWSLVALDAPNAFAIPYGGIYVTRGLLSFSETEDEVYFVMGHEMGHVERRHSSFAFQRNLLIRIGLLLLTSDNNADWMQYAYLGNQLLDLHFSRQNEHSADREGAMYSYLGGYDPWGGVVFFRKLDQRYGRTPRFWSYLETHPINTDRIDYIRGYEALSVTDPRILTTIADGYLKRSLFRSAERHYAEALAADAIYPEAHLGLARVYAHRSELRLAQASYEAARRYGADEAVVNAELQLLQESAPPPAGGEVILASAREVDDVRRALDALGSQTASVGAAARPALVQPFDSIDSLVAGHRAAGSQLDGMYSLGNALPQPVQELVVEGQRARGLALQTAAQVSGIQDDAEATLSLVEQNRERILKRLDERPTVAVVATARAVLLDGERAAEGVRDGAARLDELKPLVRDSIETSHRAIESLNRNSNPALAHSLQAAEQRTREASRRTETPAKLIHSGRTRALESSIDITMLDRLPYERILAQRVIEHFTLSEPGAVAPLLEQGLTYGEAAYVLAMAASGETPAMELAADVRDAGRRESVDRLTGRGFGRTLSAAIMMKFIDNTLKDELDYDYGTQLAHADAEPMPTQVRMTGEQVGRDEPDETEPARGTPRRDVARPRR